MKHDITQHLRVVSIEATDGPVLVCALLQARIPFTLGFARSARIRARLASLTGQQRRWLQHGGAIRLGWCPGDSRLQLIAITARTPTDDRGPWVYVTSI